MITLYGFGKIFRAVIGETRDLRVQWALEEMKLPYQVRGLDRMRKDFESPEFMRISPFKLAPVIDDDGFVLAESGAIVLYLAEKSGKLMPKDFQGRATVMQWCFSAVSTVERPMMEIQLIDKFGPEDFNRRALMVKEAGRWLSSLDRRLEGREWIATDEFSVADLLLSCVLRAIRHTDLLDSYPRLKDFYARTIARPAWDRALKLYAERLGVTVDEIR